MENQIEEIKELSLIEELEEWIYTNRLQAKKVKERLYRVTDVGLFLLIEPKDIAYDDKVKPIILDEDFDLTITADEEGVATDFYVFKFGDNFYYSATRHVESLVPFKYLGKADLNFDQVPFLGIHGAYELCNGSRDYSDWIKKAKFFNISTVGICELNTLGGAMAFQNACSKANIKSVIGESFNIKLAQETINIKLYVKNQEGFHKLLRINNTLSTREEKLLELKEIKTEWTPNLIAVIAADTKLNLENISFLQSKFQNLYFQVDFTQWQAGERDKEWLETMQSYITKYQSKIPPIFIQDAYYLDKEEAKIKKILNKIGAVGFKAASEDQWLKSVDDVLEQSINLFTEKGEDVLIELIQNACDNTNKVDKECVFKINVGNIHIPQYELIEKDNQYGTFETPEDLFYTLIEKAFQEKIAGKVANEEVYWDRIDEEMRVINMGGFIHYFLIMWDVMRFCKEEKIWVGLGRGSAAGCLISYLLGIVGVDPIKYNLLFSRFLNESRVKKSMPDIDSDFASSRRDEVKEYLRKRYGYDHTAFIGTYSTLKLKAAFRAIGRTFKMEPQTMNFYSHMMDAEGSFRDLFRISQTTGTPLKDLIKKRPDILELIPLCLDQPAGTSIHAAGVIIVPKIIKGEEVIINDLMPIKNIDGVQTTEWEGPYLEEIGFLKCDILGLSQLDKFDRITELIQLHHGITVRYDDMPLDDYKVYELFKKGLCEDIFQFSGNTIVGIIKELIPERIEDLIALVSIGRPGPIEIGIPKEFSLRKNGYKEADYDWGTEEITKNTYGLLCYQEQITQIVQKIGGLTLAESEDVRKAMGKKIPELMEKYRTVFTEGAIQKGCDEVEAIKIWQKMEGFAGYAFNLSHATCYAIMGYFSQWFKANYPLEFWTASLEFCKKPEDVVKRLAEMEILEKVRVSSADINKSKTMFSPDPTTNNIYWSMSSIKWVGAGAVEAIIAEREAFGPYFSLEEFLNRITKKECNKRAVTNLILAGAFDELENIKEPKDRIRILEQLFQLRNEKKIPELMLPYKRLEDYEWILLQKSLAGFGRIDFKDLLKKNGSRSDFQEYCPFDEIQDEEKIGRKVLTCGLVTDVIERVGKKAGRFIQITIEENSKLGYITVWNDIYEPNAEDLSKEELVGKIILISGTIVKDSYKQMNVMHSCDSTIIKLL